MNDLNKNTFNKLFSEVRKIVEQSKTHISTTINSTISATYWQIGKKIKSELLNNKRAEYGKHIIANLSSELTKEYGKGWSKQHLQHCLRFAETFPDYEIVSTLWRELSWSHFKILMYQDVELKMNFYTQMCRIERWSTRTLQQKIDAMLFERTAISKKPEELAKLELKKLETENNLSPDLIFKDHYILDFLNLKDVYSESDLESAILRELENFIIELGIGFSFVARQKRMTIDNIDFYLDLLFYHRKLKRLVAIELKIGKFKPAYKGQMELYLRWLEKHEMEKGEELPIGLILCAEGNQEQVELLQLDIANIKVAEYISKQLPKNLLEKKLQEFATKAKQILEKQDER